MKAFGFGHGYAAPPSRVVASGPIPAISVAPVVSGTPTTGSTLTTTHGTWLNGPITSYAFQWMRDGHPISGAAADTYVLVWQDEGHDITCRVRAFNANGAAFSTSNVISVALTAPTNITAPYLTGTGAVGETLNLNFGTWTRNPTSYVIVWKADGTPISGETSAAYTLLEANADAVISATAAAVNAAGTSAPVTVSNPVAVAPFLGLLTLDNLDASVAVLWSATIGGNTVGTALAATATDGTPLTIVGTTVSGTFSSAADVAVDLVETDADATNSPRTTRFTVSVASTVPGAVAAFAAAGSAGQVSLSWTDGADGGATITSHKIYRSTVAGFTPGPGNLLTSTSAASPLVDSGLTNGTTYYYAISAVNATGEGAPSTLKSATPLSVPDAVATFTATAGNAQTSLAWTDGANGGSAITSHKIYRSTAAGFTPGPGNLYTEVTSASPYIDTGLTNGTTYYYAIGAVNAIGESVVSAVKASTPQTLPDAVTSFTVTPDAGQVSIAWTDGANGGSAITGHKLYRGTSAGALVLIGTIVGGSPYVDSGLTNGTTYYYAISAVTAFGEGIASATKSATPQTLPDAVTSFTVTASAGQVSVAWTDGSNGGSAITGHNLYRGTSAGSLTLLGTIVGSSPYVDNGLTNGTTYFYGIRAVNALGEGAPSTVKSATPQAVPDAVSSFTATAGVGQVSLAWTDGADGGSAITAHKIYRSTSAGFTPGPGNLLDTTSAGSPYTDSGLTNGTTYYYAISAVSAIGEGAVSTLQSAMPQTVPDAVSAFTATAGAGQISLTWTDGSTGGAAITSHKIYRSTSAGFTPGPGNLLDTTVGASPYVDTGLTNGTTYYYAISAVNSIGEGAVSTLHSATPQTVPDAVASFTATAGAGQASLAWTDGSTGGAAITSHKIYRSTVAGFTPGPGNLLTSTGAASPYVDTGLTNGTTYYYAISAVNAAGEGTTSTLKSATPQTVPDAVSAFTATASTGQVSLAWTDGSNGGAAITSHKIYRSTVAGFTPGPGNMLTSTGSASPWVDTSVTNGTTYYYAISALNSLGEGPASTIQSATPVNPVPVNTTAPAVTGAGTTASPLTTTNGAWTNGPVTGYAYQWMRGVTPISGATAFTYTYVPADSGANITCQVTATNAQGSSTPAASNSIAAGTIAAATFTRPTDQPVIGTGILNDHTYQCDTETGGLFGVGKASVLFPVSVTANGWLWVRLRDKTTGLAVGPIATYQVTTSTTSVSFDVPGRFGWGYIDMSTDASTWTTFAGTLAIGAGDNSLASGQSLMGNWAFTSGTSLSAAGLTTTDINNLAYTRIFATSDLYHQNDITGVVYEVPGGTNHPGPGAAMYLSKMAQVRQRNQSLALHAVAGSSQSAWQPAGTSLFVTQLNRVIGATGGSYRYVLWWQGQADASANILAKHYTRDLNFHMFGALTGSGTTGGLAAKNSYVDPATGLNSRTGGVRYLISTINNMLIGPYYYGPMPWSNEIRLGGYNWTTITPGAVHVPMEGLQLDSGWVHPTAIGGVQAGRNWARAATSDNLGPVLVSAVRDATNPNEIIATFSVNGSLVLTGNWWTRFVAYISGSTRSRWTISNGNQTGVNATNQVRLVLQSSPVAPSLGDAFDLWLAPAYDGDPVSDGSLHIIRDNRTDTIDGVGRAFQPSLTPVAVAALNTGVAKTANGSIPVYVAPSSMHDITFVTNAQQSLVLPTYAAAELPGATGFGRPLIGGRGAGILNRVGGQTLNVGGNSVGQTLVARIRIPATIPTNNLNIFVYGTTTLTYNKVTGNIQANMLTTSVGTQTVPIAGKIYWLALTVVGDQAYLYYKNVTDNTATVRVVGSTHMTQLFSTIAGAISISPANGSESFLGDNTGAIFDVGLYSEPIYTDIAANIVVPTAPLTGNEQYLQHLWRLTLAEDVSNVQPDKVLIN